jgi:hypothetical protein
LIKPTEVYQEKTTMNIYDLNHWEEMNEANNLVGGAGTFDFLIDKEQFSSLDQYGFSEAKAEAQFGGATAISTVINTADVDQVIV